MKHIYYLYLFVVLGGLSSCAQRMYFPESANTPCFKGAHEFKATFATKLQSNGSDSNKVHSSGSSPSFDAAYSITDHLAVIGSYRSVLNRYINEPTGYNLLNVFGGMFNGHSFEGGGGYFTDLEGLRIEAFGGYGNGALARKGYVNSSEDFNTRYNRFFVQPAIGYSSDNFTVMGGIRMSVLRYYLFQAQDPNLRYTIYENDNGNEPDVTQSLFCFVEPFINMEAGYKFARFDFQTGFSKQVTGGHVGGDLPIYVSMGVVFYYAPRFFHLQRSKPAADH